MTMDQFLIVSSFWIGLFAILFLIGILITGLLIFNKVLRRSSSGNGNGSGDEPGDDDEDPGFGDIPDKIAALDEKITRANQRITNLHDKTKDLIAILENMTNNPFTPEELNQLIALKNSSIEPPDTNS